MIEQKSQGSAGDARSARPAARDVRRGATIQAALRTLRRRPLLALALGSGLEVVAMALLSPALVPFPAGTPGGVGVAIAVLAAVAAGPLVGTAVALVGWSAFFLVVAAGAPLALVALPIWALTAYVVGRLANSLAEGERELAARDIEREELRRLDKLKSAFIALASHELRSPAAVIYGIAATLEQRADSLTADQAAQLRRALHEQSDRLRRLVDQLLDLSRLEASAIEIRPEPLSVRARIEEIVRLVGDERASDVEIDVPPDLEATVDANAFERIVSNLVANAFRHGEAPIRVAAEERDRHFRLTVEDRGRGVRPEFASRLFERFARSESARATSEGTGLGLSIARAYAHAHGGDVYYEPAEPRGSRFHLVLPRRLSKGGEEER